MTSSQSFRDIALLVRRAHEGGAFDEILLDHEAEIRGTYDSGAYGASWRRYRRRCQTVVIDLVGWRGNSLARLAAELVVDRFLEKGVLLGAPRSEKDAGRWKRA